jgi:uncharacterized protein (DUF924 family)
VLEKILSFWFAEENKNNLFKKDINFDNLIKENFLEFFEESVKSFNLLEIHNKTDLLSYVILFDQFSRNMFRDKKEAFATDDIALSLTIASIYKGEDSEFETKHRNFLYLPLMHSEKLAIQELSIKKFKEVNNGEDHSYAIAHYNIIKQFGRFPHRNKILGRTSTTQELEFLQQPNSGF